MSGKSEKSFLPTKKTKMSPELIYRMEIARVIKARIREVEAVQECAGSDLAFHRSLKFWDEWLVRGLQQSVETFAPIRAETLPNGGGELAEFVRALEYGEVPAPKAAEVGGQRSEVGGQPESSLDLDFVRRSICFASRRGKKNGTTDGTDNTDKKKLRYRRRSLKSRESASALSESSSVASVVNSGFPALPSEEKSREVMSQWRD